MDSDVEHVNSPSRSESFDSEMTFKEEPEEDRIGSPEYLKFSIENILRPDFGRQIKQERCSPRPTFSPNETPRKHSIESEQPTHWPAWVFCTRYSDRPSSGRGNFVILNFIKFETYGNCKTSLLVLFPIC